MLTQERLYQYCLLIRWNKPVGTLLLLWPTLTALFIATQGHPSALLLFIFFTGVFVMRAAGCVVNDLIDMKFDKYVTRTQNRPLTNGSIQIWEAISILIILLGIAFVLVLFLNTYCFVLACIGVVLTIIYPFMKRFFQLPQGILGIVFNLGVPMAFAANNNTVSFIGWFLFFIAILWTIAYDTLYAMSDREDDLKLQLKSSAIWFGVNDRFIVAGLQIVIIIGLLILGGLVSANAWFYEGIVVVILTFIYQQYLIKDRVSEHCLAAFTNNQWSWFFIFFGIYLNYLK